MKNWMVKTMAFEHGFKMGTYFSPNDNTEEIFLDFIRNTKSHLRIAVYGLHLPKLIDELIALHNAGVDVALVVDHTQARGKYERPEIVQLRQAGVPLVEGTSTHHRIMHHKFVVRDKVDVLAGSWNFSQSASEESNWFDIIHLEERAKLFLSVWQEMWDWISANESQYQN
jgi:phosphatidylserine/phosphatidylglycerophosphate/cardiolipin synthase-like enzyme